MCQLRNQDLKKDTPCSICLKNSPTPHNKYDANMFVILNLGIILGRVDRTIFRWEVKKYGQF